MLVKAEDKYMVNELSPEDYFKVKKRYSEDPVAPLNIIAFPDGV